MTSVATIRVLLADDHVMVRDGLKRLIDEQQDMHVVAEAADGPEALQFAQSCSPDIALLDISMPGWDGVTTARQIVATCPQVRIIAVTRHDDEGFVRKMLDAGASGYVLKQSSTSDLVRAVRAVAGGRQYVDSAIKPLTAVPSSNHEEPAATVDDVEPLTGTERDVLRLMAKSWSNHRIAERLGMDADAIATARNSAMLKAGLLTRLQVLRYVRERGWLRTFDE